jgi:hypothetical protein
VNPERMRIKDARLLLLADSVAKVGRVDWRRNFRSAAESVLNLSSHVKVVDESMLRSQQLTRLAFDIWRKVRTLVREISGPMVAIGCQVVGQVENAARAIRQIGLRAVRRKAIEKQHVTRLRRYRDELEPSRLRSGERTPFLADQSRKARRTGHFETTVLDGCAVDGDEGSHEQGCVTRPARLLILVRLETSATGHLEVYLLLEKAGRRAKKLLDRHEKSAGTHQFVEFGVIGAKILDPLIAAELIAAEGRDQPLDRWSRSPSVESRPDMSLRHVR